MTGPEGRILVVEDDASVRRFIGRVLQNAGYTVLQVGHADAAKLLMREYAGDVQLLVVDVFLPDTGGLDFANWLDREYPGHAPVLYTSGASQAIAVDGIIRRQPEMVLLKPFTGAELLRRVARALSQNT